MIDSVYCYPASLSLATTTLSHTSADIVQCVVFTPLFATLPPSLYIIRCDTVNFFYLLRYFSIYPSAPVRGWGFAFGAWGRDIENRDCLYTNPILFQKVVYKNPYKPIGRRAPNDEQ
nr:MAG TPA: hypothetical protein [Caudoviricetes sp.]